MKPRSEFRRTKIVCTIGPSVAMPAQIRELIYAGMDVARLNFSHGDRDTHRETIRTLRRAAVETGKEIGILQDLGGPKIRLGKLCGERRQLRKGERVVLVPGETSEPDAVPVNYPGFAEDVAVGDRILLADGSVQLSVTEKNGSRVIGEVLVGGLIVSRKGVNLPSSNLAIAAFTDKDFHDLALGIDEGVDFVALSFIRNRKDLVPVLDILNRIDRRPLLIAKIEKPQAVEGFDEILALVDGVMVARGDLGVEMPLEDVPIIQKRIIRIARQAGKPVITATQMLTSMLENPRPTRAETTDVANAILDGTDALMLSDETAMGLYPFEAVSTLDRIARTTEPYIDESRFLNESMSDLLPGTAAAISRAACWLAIDLQAAAVVATSSSGSTARLVARFRPPCPIIGLTDRIETQRQLSLSWGVIPQLVDAFHDTDRMFASARSWALERGLATEGDRLIITAGVPVGVSGTTNLLKVMELS
jgi:pyruvate kinase